MGTIAVGERNKMLDAYTGRANYTAPAAFFVKLHLGDPGAAGTSNAAAETTRQEATFGDAAASGTIANTVELEWASLPATETFTHVSFWSASSGGTFLGSDDLPTPAAMEIGELFRIPVGELQITLPAA